MRTATKIGLVSGIMVIAGAGAFAWLARSPAPDLRGFEGLREPRLTRVAPQRMIEVRLTGDPGQAGAQAFGRLFRTFYAIKRTVPGLRPTAPRARWPGSFAAPRAEWVGVYGLPVPEDVKSLPANSRSVNLVTWEYGDVAEILHVGSYATEGPTIDKLRAFIKQQGYEVIGDHEEEYLRGPGMFFKGNPDRYYTIIRYRVARLAS